MDVNDFFSVKTITVPISFRFFAIVQLSLSKTIRKNIRLSGTSATLSNLDTLKNMYLFFALGGVLNKVCVYVCVGACTCVIYLI